MNTTNRMKQKRVIVTGASAGFGEAIARVFAAGGCHLELWARREERLNALAGALQKQHDVSATPRVVDVRDRAAVGAPVATLRETGWIPDVLVNNAGLASGLNPVHEGDYDDWDAMIDTNLKGLLNVTREVLPLMVERDCGHVINIGSVAGYIAYPKGNVYNATKFAVRGLTEAMNVDLFGTRVRMSSVDPGAAETEFSIVRFHGDEERAKHIYDGFQPLTAEDIADAVWYVANAPDHVNVSKLVMLPTAQRNPYLIHREES
jgi:serine 3-dehydrogenase